MMINFPLSRSVRLAAAVLAFLASPVSAQGLPWKDKLIVARGNTIIALAKDGATQWQVTLGDSGPIEITPASKTPWLATGDRLWAFDPDQGKVVWPFPQENKQAPSPSREFEKAHPIGENAWVTWHKDQQQWRVESLAPSDGRLLWSQTFSEKPAALNDDGESPLLLKQGKQLCAFTEQGLVWKIDADWQQSWLYPKYLFALAGNKLLAFDRSSGKKLWEHQLPPLEPLPKDYPGKTPVGIQLELGERYLIVQAQDLTMQRLDCIDPADGRVVWQKPSFSAVQAHVNWAGPHLVHRLHEEVELLAEADGHTESVLRMRTFTTRGYFWQGQVLTVGRYSFPEPQVDARGKIPLDSSGNPKTESVDGFLVYLGDRLLEADPRSPCRLEQVKNCLIIGKKPKPLKYVGQPNIPDKRFSEPPLKLMGWSKPGTKAWQWNPENREQRAQWERAGEHLILIHADGSVSELNPETGATAWKSPRLWLGEGVRHNQGKVKILARDDGFWIEAENDQFYFLDSHGKLLGHADLRPWFDSKKKIHLVALLLLGGSIAYYIQVARSRKLFIRKIAGLEAIDEAVGRATEMGRPVLYVPGLEEIDEIQTLASLSILSHVAKKTADYDSEILVPTRRAMVMSTAQEVVKEAYTVAGRPDGYIAENIRYLTDDQFGFVAGVDGIMMRERPAANFYLGMFYGEALILTETGFSTGAIQIAGTAAASQLPFFVATCDYTLMGEELYAASAYLSQDPLQVGSLRGQDVGKALVMTAIVSAAVLQSLGVPVKMWLAS